MIETIQTPNGIKLRRLPTEPAPVAAMPTVGEPPFPGATYDSVAGVWRKGAFIVPTGATVGRVPVRTDKGSLSPQQARIRAMSKHTNAGAVKALLRRHKTQPGESREDRLEYVLAVALLDAGIDPEAVQVAPGADDGRGMDSEPV